VLLLDRSFVEAEGVGVVDVDVGVEAGGVGLWATGGVASVTVIAVGVEVLL